MVDTVIPLEQQSDFKCDFHQHYLTDFIESALEFISGHFVVFSEDIFGVLFLELRSFSMFHRVSENLHAINADDINPK